MTTFIIGEITNREIYGEYIITLSGSFENWPGLDEIKKVSSEFLLTINLVPCDETTFITESSSLEKIFYPMDQSLII